LEFYLATPNHHVIAANRDATGPTSQALLNLPTAHGSKLTIMKIYPTSPTDAALAAQHFKGQDVTHLDIAVANAGIYLGTPLVRDLDIADLQASLETNVFGTVRLYQAMRPLLLNADRLVWVTIESSGGWLE
jgi:NAD(P)-dependent dehydrogenase (short-subunit alcohol dehydrogenase family)